LLPPLMNRHLAIEIRRESSFECFEGNSMNATVVWRIEGNSICENQEFPRNVILRDQMKMPDFPKLRKVKSSATCPKNGELVSQMRTMYELNKQSIVPNEPRCALVPKPKVI
jgi:hypothetical protein